jgi:hypothetical protein
MVGFCEGRILNEMVVAYFKLLFWHLYEETEDDHDKSWSDGPPPTRS